MASAKISIPLLMCTVLMIPAARGYAEEGGKQPPAVPGWTTEAVKTGKERLSDKASDEQRVDNCKVPTDRRGPKIRPERCE